MSRVVRLLMVEDNPGDVLLARENFERCKLPHALYAVEDGQAALAFLRREEPYGDAPRPHMILLDLNLPGMDGREVLSRIKGDPTLRDIPVVILTSSEAERDVVRSYELHASAYVVKPVDLNGFVDVVRAIEGFWLARVRYPRMS